VIALLVVIDMLSIKKSKSKLDSFRRNLLFVSLLCILLFSSLSSCVFMTQGAEDSLENETNDVDLSYYSVTVIGGDAVFSSAQGYVEGETVYIESGPAPVGFQFCCWTTSSEVSLDDPYSTMTSFIMPAKSVTITSEFEEIDRVVLTDIKVTRLPLRVFYRVGETLDLSGLAVTAQYSDGSTKPILGYLTTPANGEVLNEGVQTVTISYTEDNMIKTTNFAVTAYWTGFLHIEGQPVAETIVTQGNIKGILSTTLMPIIDDRYYYQWYSYTVDSNGMGIPIAGATSSNFAIPTDLTAAGSPYYYYCEVNGPRYSYTVSDLAAVIVILPQVSYAQAFPDMNFRQAVLDLLNAYGGERTATSSITDTDKTILAAQTELDLSSRNIADLTGIEYFTELTRLNCSNNNLVAFDRSQTALDVSQNTKLTYLDCSYNAICSPDGVVGWRELGLKINANYDPSYGTFHFYPQAVYTFVGLSITAQPTAFVSVPQGSINIRLSVRAALVEKVGEPTYQWYSTTSPVASAGATPIIGATSPVFPVPSDLTEGHYYYFCVIGVPGWGWEFMHRASTVATVSVTPPVERSVLESIAVTTMPIKTMYAEGETLDLTGLIVTATYSDGSSKAVQDYITEPKSSAELNIVGIQEIMITYMEGDVTAATSFNVTVMPRVIVYPVVVLSEGIDALGNGSYEAGVSVRVFAGVAPEGYRFKLWTTSSEIVFDNSHSATTVFVMPAESVEVKAVFKSIAEAIAAYNQAYTDFSSYYDTSTWQFRKDLFTEYTVESVLEAEQLMNAAGQLHADLLALHGRLDAGRFSADDDVEVIEQATHILIQAIEDMKSVLKPWEVPVLFADVYDLGSWIRVWFSYPVGTEHVAVTVDGQATAFDDPILSGARTWLSGAGYLDAYSYIDVSKAINWQLMLLKVTIPDYVLVVELENDWYVPPVEWVTTVVEPTCVSEGYTVRCYLPTGERWFSDYIPALGHKFETLDYEDNSLHACTVCGYVDETGAYVVSASPSAWVTKLNGNKNDLTITITEQLSNGSTNTLTQTFSINNNSADTYTIGSYKIYVDTTGNTQIRACYLV